jgi:hypothetical protein
MNDFKNARRIRFSRHKKQLQKVDVTFGKYKNGEREKISRCFTTKNETQWLV